MRLSAYVNQHGIDAFNFDDFVFVSQHVAKSPDPLILVGGQALETWGLAFKVQAPTGDHAPLTEDADWLGSKKDALWLCERLGKQNTELMLAGDFDSTPSTALAYLRRPDGRVLMMDFLRTIVGPSAEDVRRLAVTVRIADQVTLNVLHPLLCLESRMGNLEVIPVKRTGNGPMQAQWAVAIVSAYLQTWSATASKDELAKACRCLAEMAEFKYGRYCWTNYRLDPLQSVGLNLVEQIGGQFESQEWPRVVKRIVERRRKWDEQAQRLSNQ